MDIDKVATSARGRIRDMKNTQNRQKLLWSWSCECVCMCMCVCVRERERKCVYDNHLQHHRLNARTRGQTTTNNAAAAAAAAAVGPCTIIYDGWRAAFLVGIKREKNTGIQLLYRIYTVEHPCICHPATTLHSFRAHVAPSSIRLMHDMYMQCLTLQYRIIILYTYTECVSTLLRSTFRIPL